MAPSEGGVRAKKSSFRNRSAPRSGPALLSTIAAAAAAGYLAAHATDGPTAAVVHGFAVAMAWGAGLLVLAAIPVAVSITAAAPVRRPAA